MTGIFELFKQTLLTDDPCCSKSINLGAEQIVRHYLTQKRNFQLALFRMSAQFQHQLIGNWPLPLGRLRGEKSLKIHFGCLKLQEAMFRSAAGFHTLSGRVQNFFD